MKPTLTGRTLPLYQIKDKYVSKGFKEAEPVKRPSWLENPGPMDKQFTDQALQNVYGPQVGVTQGLSVDGIGQGFSGPNGTYSVDSVPPDTDVAVGTTQVVSLDNTAFAVFDKTTGAVTAGPYNTNVLWSVLGTSSICESEDDGDGIVKFDQLAQRWLITQFALGATDTGPFADCVAISQTADATGSWTVFQFVPSPVNGYFPDYPKLSVWPNVYSMTFDMFNSAGTVYEGAGICGIDRIALLAGNSPTIVCAQLTSSDYALLPVDLDGSTYPATGAKALYIEQNSTSAPATQLYMYRAAYNFTAGTVTVDPQVTITVTSYNSTTCAINTQKCVPQPPHTGSLPAGETFASESTLDTLAYHMMHRAAYRNFGSYESITLSGAVLPSTGSNTAERWYEIRTPFGTPTVYQQSTYSPDTSLYRWMGSIAQDHQGNMLMGYSGSSATVFPSVYVTGRLNTDAINTMESETQLFAGLNSQVNITGYPYGYRWGDYTAMMLDPNDCTFWYTGEYLKQAGEFNWSTRLFNLSFPSCTSTAAITMPVPSTTLTSNSATFLWTASNNATAYWIDIGSAAGGNNYCSSGSLSTTTFSATVSGLPTNGSTIYVTMYSLISGSWVSNAYTFTAYNNAVNKGVITSPVPSSTLSGSSVTFNWTAGTGATAYWLDIGNAAGGNNYYSSGNLGNVFTTSVNGLPTNGSTVYVTLYSQVSGVWLSNAYTYTAYGAGTAGVMQTPTPTSTLSGSSVQFTWSAGTNANNYWIDIGTSLGGNNIYSSGQLGNVLKATVNGLPTNGTTLYLTLYSLVGGNWLSNAYQYTAFNALAAAGILMTPSPNSTLTSGTVTFDWTAGAGASAYWLDVGSTSGGNNYYSSGSLSTTPPLQVTVTTLPTNGTPVYATLYSLIGGQWFGNTYNYTALNASSAAMQTPIPGSQLSTNAVTFTWSAGTGATAYWLDVGSTAGGNNYYSSGNLGNVLMTTAPNLPAIGRTIYATLYSYVGGQWLSNSYTYTAAPGAVMQTPMPGSPLSGNPVTFTWTAAGTGVTGYEMTVGSTYGGSDIYSPTGSITSLSTTVSTLPANGSTIYVTLYSYFAGGQLQNYYSYVSGP